MLDKMVKIEAYFGTDIQGERTVSDESFESFKTGQLDTRFDCYTVKTAMGRWKGVDEKTFLVEIIVKAGPEQYLAGHKLAEAIEIYNDAFLQECVLMTVTEIGAQFV